MELLPWTAHTLKFALGLSLRPFRLSLQSNTAISLNELGIVLKKLAEDRRTLALQEQEVEQAIAIIKDKLEKATKRRRKRNLVREETIHVYCDDHRDELTNGRKTKSAEFPYGTIQWRHKQDSVLVMQDAGVIVEQLKETELFDLIRTKEAPDKKAILAAADKVEDFPDIQIVSRKESFSIKTEEKPLANAAFNNTRQLGHFL